MVLLLPDSSDHRKRCPISPFEYESWDQFWRGTRAAGPTQMAIDLAGLDAFEDATRKAVEPLTAEDGSILFKTNIFIYAVGQA